MSAREKWEFYVEKLRVAELKAKDAIIEYRNYKKAFVNYRYEKDRTPKQLELFNIPPNVFINKIFSARARVNFCKLKINYYRTISKEGQTLNNKLKLSNLEKQCADLISKYGSELA